jgi:DNA processing protein
MKRGIPTCAILASGSNFLYPTKHIPIYKEIVDSGGMILTPYEANTHIAAYRFLERNVLLAAICDAIIVIEALE